MRFLVDRCAGHQIALWLRKQGHDVKECREFGSDPGDRKLLALATEEKRILITIDTDFGTLIYRDLSPHSGLVRLPDVPAGKRIEFMEQVLEKHAGELEQGAIITVQRNVIRISLGKEP